MLNQPVGGTPFIALMDSDGFFVYDIVLAQRGAYTETTLLVTIGLWCL